MNGKESDHIDFRNMKVFSQIYNRCRVFENMTSTLNNLEIDDSLSNVMNSIQCVFQQKICNTLANLMQEPDFNKYSVKTNLTESTVSYKESFKMIAVFMVDSIWDETIEASCKQPGQTDCAQKSILNEIQELNEEDLSGPNSPIQSRVINTSLTKVSNQDKSNSNFEIQQTNGRNYFLEEKTDNYYMKEQNKNNKEWEQRVKSSDYSLLNPNLCTFKSCSRQAKTERGEKSSFISNSEEEYELKTGLVESWSQNSLNTNQRGKINKKVFEEYNDNPSEVSYIFKWSFYKSD